MIDPTGYTALDLVGYTDRGTYAAATNYVKNDLAHHNGIIWRCLIDDTIGITPVEGANWTVFINAGSAAAEEIIAPIETSPAEAAHTSGTQLIYNDTLYDVIANISIGDSLTVGTNIQAANKVMTQVTALKNAAKDKVLFFDAVACSALTGNFATINDAAITANHVLADCMFMNSSAITSDVSWTSSAGSFVLNGTCSSATTAIITLVKKDN